MTSGDHQATRGTATGTGEVPRGARFGRTQVVAVAGSPLAHTTEAIACGANTRGMMGVGVAGAIRLAGGADIEREIMRHAPLAVGSAYVTGPGSLATTGVRCIIHAVVADSLGAPAREDSVRRATATVLREADRAEVRSLLLPPFGAGLGVDALPASRVWLVMIEEIIAHVRRFRPRVERIVLLCRDEREVHDTTNALRAARVLWPTQDA